MFGRLVNRWPCSIIVVHTQKKKTTELSILSIGAQIELSFTVACATFHIALSVKINTQRSYCTVGKGHQRSIQKKA